MRKWMMLAAAAALGGCSAEHSSAPSQSTGAAEQSLAVADVPADAKSGKDGAPAPLAVSVPQLAYAYKLGFLLPGDKIGPVQEAHRALCERMGPARCQLLALTSGQAQDASGQASLKLRIASAEARGFQQAAAKAVGDAGGRAIATNVTAEDVSKAIVDAQARINQRELLVARLTEILRTRTGKVAELVEAERSVADAQEELDKARAWLAELRTRVAMSDFEIAYSATAPSASPASTGTQLGEAVSGSAASFLIGLRGLLTLLIYLLPWAVLVIPFLLVARAARRHRARSNAAIVAKESEQADG